MHVRDLSIPDDVTLLTDPDEIIAKVQAPRIEVEEEPVVEEGEEGVEGGLPRVPRSAEGEAPSGGESASDEGASEEGWPCGCARSVAEPTRAVGQAPPIRYKHVAGSAHLRPDRSLPGI